MISNPKTEELQHQRKGSIVSINLISSNQFCANLSFLSCFICCVAFVIILPSHRQTYHPNSFSKRVAKLSYLFQSQSQFSQHPWQTRSHDFSSRTAPYLSKNLKCANIILWLLSKSILLYEDKEHAIFEAVLLPLYVQKSFQGYHIIIELKLP